MGKTIQVTKNLVLLAILATIVFVQEIALSFIPNVAFTTLLIILYSRLLGLKKTIVVVILYVMLDVVMMPTNPIAIPSLMIGWLIIPILLNTLFKRHESVYFLTAFAFCHGFVFGWINIPTGMIILDLPFKAYFMQDLPFEIIMAISSSLTVLWIYEPLYKRLKPFFDRLNP